MVCTLILGIKITVQVSDTGDISVEYRMTDYFQKSWFIFPVKKQEAPQMELD